VKEAVDGVDKALRVLIGNVTRPSWHHGSLAFGEVIYRFINTVKSKIAFRRHDERRY